jgi:BolA protein
MLIDQIKALLVGKLPGAEVTLDDESAEHAGHAGALSGGGHFRLRIVAPDFLGLSRIARHRLVYDAVADLMHGRIHALAIVALTPEEAGSPPARG